MKNGKVMKAYNLFGIVKKIGLVISCIATIIMVFFIFYDVFSRNIFSTSIRGGFEIVQNYFMPVIVFPGLAYVYASGVIPKMDLLLEKFQDNIKKIIIFVLVIIELFILALLFIYTWDHAIDGLQRKVSFPAAGTLYPVYPVFFTVPFAFLLIFIENIFIFIRNIFGKTPSFTVIEEDEETYL